MTGTTRPGGRTARTKEAVFEAVAALIAERGYGNIAMTDIAAKCGRWRNWSRVIAPARKAMTASGRKPKSTRRNTTCEGEIRAVAHFM